MLGDGQLIIGRSAISRSVGRQAIFGQSTINRSIISWFVGRQKDAILHKLVAKWPNDHKQVLTEQLIIHTLITTKQPNKLYFPHFNRRWRSGGASADQWAIFHCLRQTKKSDWCKILNNRKCTAYYVVHMQVWVDPTENRIIAKIICQLMMDEEDGVKISILRVD